QNLTANIDVKPVESPSMDGDAYGESADTMPANDIAGAEEVMEGVQAPTSGSAKRKRPTLIVDDDDDDPLSVAQPDPAGDGPANEADLLDLDFSVASQHSPLRLTQPSSDDDPNVMAAAAAMMEDEPVAAAAAAAAPQQRFVFHPEFFQQAAIPGRTATLGAAAEEEEGKGDRRNLDTRTLFHLRVGRDRCMRCIVVMSYRYAGWFERKVLDMITESMRRLLPAKLKREADSKEKGLADVCVVGDSFQFAYSLRDTDVKQALLIKTADASTYEGFVIHSQTLFCFIEPVPLPSGLRRYGIGSMARKKDKETLNARPAKDWVNYGKSVQTDLIKMSSKLRFKGETKKKKTKKRKADDDHAAAEVDEVTEGWVDVKVAEDLNGPIMILSPTSEPPSALNSTDMNVLTFKPLHPSPDSQFEPDHVGQVFLATHLPTGKLSLKSAFDKYLSADRFGVVTCTTDAVGPREEWEVVMRDDGCAFQAGEKFLCDEEGVVRCDSEKIGFRESFRVRCQAQNRASAKKRKAAAGADAVRLEEDQLKKFQSWGNGRRVLSREDTIELQAAKKRGQLNEAMLDRREKIKSDKFCK
ncbi:hypothetical protein HK101_004936, partial [Irineochytrium annulatum]